MKIGEGVEWGAHACAVLATLPDGAALSAAALAAFHALPPAYMAKHLQALARAGIIHSSRGARGGYRLARPAAHITLWDVLTAIEGPGPRFVCQNIRARGPCAARRSSARPCQIAAVFWSAEAAFEAALRAVSIFDIATQVGSVMAATDRQQFADWLLQARSP